MPQRDTPWTCGPAALFHRREKIPASRGCHRAISSSTGQVVLRTGVPRRLHPHMPTSLFTNPSRRDLLLALASAGLASSGHGAESLAGRTIEPASHHAVIAQIFDVSPAQQDVSRDLVAGS